MGTWRTWATRLTRVNRREPAASTARENRPSGGRAQRARRRTTLPLMAAAVFACFAWAMFFCAVAFAAPVKLAPTADEQRQMSEWIGYFTGSGLFEIADPRLLPRDELVRFGVMTNLLRRNYAPAEGVEAAVQILLGVAFPGHGDVGEFFYQTQPTAEYRYHDPDSSGGNGIQDSWRLQGWAGILYEADVTDVYRDGDVLRLSGHVYEFADSPIGRFEASAKPAGNDRADRDDESFAWTLLSMHTEFTPQPRQKPHPGLFAPGLYYHFFNAADENAPRKTKAICGRAKDYKKCCREGKFSL